MNAHRLAEERSLELHRRIATLLERDPALIERARTRVRGWSSDGSVAAPYVDAWTRLLDGPFSALRATLVDESEEARALRQVTPFAGIVDPRTRWKIWREVRARVTGT
jgi:hypothetical protein